MRREAPAVDAEDGDESFDPRSDGLFPDSGFSLRMIEYLPVLIFLGIAIVFPIAGITVSKLLRPVKLNKAKQMAYECGVDPISDARDRYSIHYYIIAMLFVIFDIETIFLFPWAVLYQRLYVFGFIEMTLFIAILIVGYFYAWKKGALEWE